MHYDACFLLYQLQHPDDYEDRTTFENVSFWATKPTTPHFVMRSNSNGKKTLNSTELETLKNWRKVGIFYAMEVSRYPPFLTYFKIPTPTPQPYLFVTKIIWNWFLGEQMLWAPFLWPLGVYIEFKVKLQTHTNKKKKEIWTGKWKGTL